jgi:hypothetical protein
MRPAIGVDPLTRRAAARKLGVRYDSDRSRCQPALPRRLGVGGPCPRPKAECGAHHRAPPLGPRLDTCWRRTGFFVTRAKLIASLAGRYRVPAIYARREYAEAGGLMSYGYDVADGYRLLGGYAARISKG